MQVILQIVAFLVELFTSWRFYLGIVLVVGPAVLVYGALESLSSVLALAAAATCAVPAAVCLERRWALFTSL